MVIMTEEGGLLNIPNAWPGWSHSALGLKGNLHQAGIFRLPSIKSNFQEREVMSAEECLQELTTFQEVSVSFTEEKEYTLDPYLFDLSGHDIRQYCSILSQLEREKWKSEMFLETPQGSSVPFSLVQVAEEFELSQGLYQGDDGTSETKLLQGSNAIPLIKMQYDFAPVSEEGVLQGNLPGSMTASEHQTGAERTELVSAGSNFSLASKPLKAQTAWQGQMGDFSATILLQEGSPQLIREQKGPLNDSLSLVYEETQTTTPSELCPTCGRKLQPSLNPTPFQLAPSEMESFECPDCGHSLSGDPAGPTEHQIPEKGWKKPLRKNAQLEKPFHCPDCGRGFVHQSSIPRHQKLHRRENFPPIFGQERSPNLGLMPLSHPELLSRKVKPTHHPANGTGEAKKQSQLGCQGASTLSSVCAQTDPPASEPCRKQAGVEKPFRCSECGKRFNHRNAVMRHEQLHWGERPFKCPHCDKSYIQKSHLKRHHQSKHSNHLIQKEAP